MGVQLKCLFPKEESCPRARPSLRTAAVPRTQTRGRTCPARLCLRRPPIGQSTSQEGETWLRDSSLRSLEALVASSKTTSMDHSNKWTQAFSSEQCVRCIQTISINHTSVYCVRCMHYQ